MASFNKLLAAVKNGDLVYINKNIKNVKKGWNDYILLNAAIGHEQKEIATFLIQKGCRVNEDQPSSAEDTPLHKSILLDDVELIKVLLKQGASVCLKNKEGDTPLHVSVKTKKNAEVTGILLESMEAISKESNISDNYGLTHMHIACMCMHSRILKSFLNCECDVNSQVSLLSTQWPGFTPLHFAVNCESTVITRLLVSKGADIHILDANKDSPLHMAFRNKNQAITRMLAAKLNKKSVNLVGHQGLSYFHIACSLHLSTVVQHFIVQKVDVNSQIAQSSLYFPGATALHIAVKNGFDTIVKKLLMKNASFIIKDQSGSTPLHIAFHKKKIVIIDLILSKHTKCYENPADENGLTHFHIACSRPYPNLIQGFIQNGIQVDCKINDGSQLLSGNTGLHIAVVCGRLENVKTLLANNASPAAKEATQMTPLHLACRGTKEKLSFLEADLIILDAMDTYISQLNNILLRVKILPIVDLLLIYNSDVNAKDKDGKIPLFHLYDRNYYDKLQSTLEDILLEDYSTDIYSKTVKQIEQDRSTSIFIMLQHHIDLTISDNNSNSIMHYVSNTCASFQDNEDKIIKLYLYHNACVNARNINDETPLLLALRNKYFKFAEIILREKVDVTVAEKCRNNTPLHELINLDHHAAGNLFQQLVRKGADLNAQNIAEDTPLHIAVENQNMYYIIMLLNYDANVNIKNSHRKTPLMCIKEGELQVLKLFANHITRIKIIGHIITEKNECFLTKMIADQNLSAYNMNNNSIITEQQCIEELEVLKTYNLDVYTTLYDILFKTSHEMTYYLNNKYLTEVYSGTISCLREFPIYLPIIKTQYRNGFLREPLIKSALNAISVLTYSRLPNSCYDRILNFLSNDNLKDLIEAETAVIINQKNKNMENNVVKLSHSSKRVKLN